jgi:hypothetical protein
MQDLEYPLFFPQGLDFRLPQEPGTAVSINAPFVAGRNNLNSSLQENQAITQRIQSMRHVRDLGIGYQWCLAKYDNGTSSLINYIACILSNSTRDRCSVYGTSRIFIRDRCSVYGASRICITPVQVCPRHRRTG